MSDSKTSSVQQHGPVRCGLIPPWLLVLFCLCYDALLFHLWTGRVTGVPRGLTIACFALAFALLTALFAAISRCRGLHLGFGLAICILWAVLYLTEYFLLDAFKNYFTFEQIFSAAGNAGEEDFAARVWDQIRTDFWRIPTMFAPLAVFGLINGLTRAPRRHTAGVRRYLFVAGLALTAVAGFCAIFVSSDTRKLKEEYTFTEAVDSFGLPMGLVLEQLNAGVEEDPFFIVDDGPKDWENPQPTDTAPATDEPVPATAESAEGSTGSEATETFPADTEGTADTEPTEVPESTEPPAPPRKPYNLMDIDFKALADSASDERIAAVHRYVSSLAPSRTNEMTGRFAGKNLIFITAEAFSAEVIDPELTPALYRLATKGIHFTDYYQPAWGGSTSTGEFSNLIGIVPTHGVKSMTEDSARLKLYFTMGNQLRRLGYFSRAYHNNSYTYYSRNKTHENLGYEKWIGMGNGMEAGVKETWPESDREMIDFTLQEYLDQQPFSIYYMSVSGHGLYSWSGNYMSQKNRDAVSHLDRSETIQAYLAANLELEYAMEDLLAALEEVGIADDTVIVLGADHYPYSLDKSAAWGNDRDYLEELYGFPNDSCFAQDHNALIIWSGCIEDEGIEVTTPVYSLDILPTLSNLFGLEYDSRLLVGRDVFSDQEPLVLWINRSWKTDLGQYNAATGVFTPAEGVTVPEGYQDRIANLVRNKFNFSEAVLNYDYYRILFPD